MSKPGDSDALSAAKPRDTRTDFIDFPDDLMAWNERPSMQVEIAFDNMNIGPANRADVYLNSNLTDGWLRLINLLQNQRRFTHWFLLG